MNPVFKHLPRKPLRSTCLTLLFALPQISLIGSFFSEPAAAQIACPAGTQAQILNWNTSNNLAGILSQNLRVGGIQATLNFTDNPLGQVTDTGTYDPNDIVNGRRRQVTRIDTANATDIYGGLLGPHLRWNIGQGRNPAPVGSSATLTITFSQLVTLASPLTLLDVDKNSSTEDIFQDRVTVTAFNGNSPVSLTGRAINPNNTRITNNPNSVLAEGILNNAANNSSNGNVEVTLDGAVNRIQIVYEPGTEFGSPQQDETIGIARLNICVPTPGASNEFRLVKRITAVIRANGQRINYQNFVDDPSDSNDNDLKPIPVGEFDVETPLASNDEVEYTIYFRAGQALNNFNICDLIPADTTYSQNSPIVVNLNGTDISTSNPGPGTFISALAPLPAGNSCVSQTNSNGAVIVNYPANIPANSFGSVTFRVRIN